MKIERRFQVGMAIIELINFFEPNEDFVEGTTMLERAEKACATIDQGTIETLIELRDLFPKPREVGNVDIVFAGVTVKLFGEHKIKVISYLHGKGEDWVVGLGGVEYDWHRRARLVRLSAVS